LPVSTIAELSNLGKAYISQVKSGKRPPSEKLIRALEQASPSRNNGKTHDDTGRAIETIGIEDSMKHYKAPLSEVL